jgi:predicted ATPase/DNA-binding SARP family transcriptional activator
MAATRPERAASPLTLRLFGSFEVHLHGKPLPRLRTRKGQWLLALLAMRPGAEVERDWLGSLLWPASTGSQALRNSLTDLRRALGEEAGRLRSATSQTLCLDLAGGEVDVVAFDAAIARGDASSLEAAVSLYRGPLLEGCGEEWVVEERQAREQAYLGALERLAGAALGSGDLAATEHYLRRVVSVDPLRESAQRALMQALASGGSCSAALLTYRELRLRLQRELNTAPDPETQALFAQIRAEARRKADGVTGRRGDAVIKAGGRSDAEQRADVLLTSSPRHSVTPSPRHSVTPSLRGSEATLTFLVTDIEDGGAVLWPRSGQRRGPGPGTQLWEQSPETMRRALARHDALLQEAIESHDGCVFKNIGDQFCATFPSAPQAVGAALELQRAVRAEPWPEGAALHVRVALHAGTVEQRDGDYFGLTLSRVARLLEVGHGGQVLLSQACAELVREHLPAGSSLRDLGERRLKGLAQPERIAQLVAPDLPVHFPPLNVPEVRRYHLPAPRKPLIGRDRDVMTLCDLLRSEAVAVVTLTGPGGSGKTRLGLEVATQLLAAFADGVCFVNLAPIRHPELVVPTIAPTLGVREEGGRSLQESLKEYLREKHLLLLLDNFEQVVEAAPLLAELLAAAPRLKVLVTSRTVLHLYGEKEFPVLPLARPDPKHLPPLGQLQEYAAVALFVQRVRDVKPEFAITEQNAPTLAEICRRLDGLPLALELAAARIKLFPLPALLARLEKRLPLLTGGPRDVPARQQTLRATIAWSYDLLTEAEQALFRRLSVFVGGCTLEAAEAVGNAEGDLQLPVMEGVASLMDQSVLRQVEPEGFTAGGGEARFVMLETIREFGLEQLEERAEAEAIRRQHARYFLRLAEETAHGYRGPALRESLDRVEAEHDNLRAALMWSHQELTGGDTEQRLVAALALFWDHRGYWREKEQWLEGALARGGPGVQCPPSGEDDQEPLATWGKLLLAADRYEASIAIWRQLGDTRWLARALASWGNHRSVAACEEAVSHFRELGDRWDLVIALYFLGNAAVAANDYPQARSHYEESLALARELGDPEKLAWPLWGLGELAQALGEYGAARSYYEETIALRREYGDAWLPHCLNDLGEVASAQGDLAQACQAFEESLAISRDRGLPEILMGALVGLGRVAWHRGELELARTRGEEGLIIAEKARDRQGIARALLLLGRVAQAQTDIDKARFLLRRSLSLCHELGEHREAAERLEGLAAVDRAQGQLLRAARLLAAADALRNTHGPPVAPIDRADREQQGATVRAALGEAAFAAAWAAGRAMSLEDAITFALQDGHDRMLSGANP